ncbi:uncharacterized protein METZ01_LOCUS382373, partial [marine metagenome]
VNSIFRDQRQRAADVLRCQATGRAVTEDQSRAVPPLINSGSVYRTL